MKRIISSALFLFTILTVSAGPVNREQAQNIAKSFLLQRGIEMTTPKVAYRAARKDNVVSEDAYYYVFNAGDNHGFVIVSGDDTTAPILGYSDTGNFDEETIPENMRSWLQFYADRIKYIEDNNIVVEPETAEQRAIRKASKAHHSIAPILTCNWNQGDPYNLKCPMYYNEDGSTGEHSATGCVATAIAQVLYHHKFPAKTKERIPALTNRYSTPDGQKSVTLPSIKTGHEIDWDNMCDNYYGSETQEQKDAVADLMLVVGQGLKMGYGASSGSSYADSRKLFVDYLGFDDGVQILRSDNYGIQEWFEMMYDELDEGYPIGYGGSSTGGGHAFVVDGFDGDEFFHLNWGWGGASNGYFRIDVLNPGDNSGIGASSSADGYSMAQDAIMYLRAEDDGETYDVESDTHATINDTEITGTKIFSNYINWTGSTNSFNCAIVAADETGTLVPISKVETISNLGANYYVGKTFDMAGKFTAPGEYHITPASKLTSNTIYRPLYDLENEYIKATVDDNLNVTLEYYAVPVEMEVTEWSFPGTLKAGDEQDAVVSLKNNGKDFKRELALYASMTDDMGNSVSQALIGVKADDTDDFAFYFNPSEAGTYNLWLTLNSDRNQVIGQTTVEIGTTAKNSASLAVGTVTVSNGSYGDFLKGTMSIKNNGQEDFSGPIELQIWKDGGDGYWWGGSGQTLYYEIPAGGTASAEFIFENLEIGGSYRFCQRNKSVGKELSGGGVFDGSQYKLKKGAVKYTKLGTMSGAAVSTTYSASNTGAAVRFYGATPANVTTCDNTNYIYVFEEGSTVPSSLDGLNVVVGNEAEVLNLTADNWTYFPTDFTARKATFAYTPTVFGNGDGNWVPLTMPFKPTSITIDGVEKRWSKGDKTGSFLLKEFTEVNDDNEVVFNDVEEISGGTPYLIAVPAELEGKTIVFSAEDASIKSLEKDKMLVGAAEFQYYGNTCASRLEGVYTMNEEGTAFVYSADKIQLESFRAYFKTKLAEAPEIINIHFEGNTSADGIKEVTSHPSPLTPHLYNLQGIRVSGSYKGIVIKDGKKTIIK